jgi:hypothetical protein
MSKNKWKNEKITIYGQKSSLNSSDSEYLAASYGLTHKSDEFGSAKTSFNHKNKNFLL